MKKRNKKKNVCAITRLWPTLESLKKELFIDLEKQEITRLSTGNKLSIYLNKSKDREQSKWYYKIGFWVNTRSYALMVHRLFFYWHHGYLPALVDHKDTNPQNNKIENLRELGLNGNARNSNKKIRKNCSSKYKGVSKERNKWVARIKDLDGKKDIRIGLFNEEDDAGQAYNDKIRELGLEEVSVLNDTPQERARKNIQFDPLPSEMNHLKDLFLNIEPLIDFK
jgi:hypothetical protein